MARGGRRQPRDARGRFASVGATARGGRLSTASGKRRATVTAKVKGQAPSGTIGKRRGKPSKPLTPQPQARNSIRRYQPTTLSGWDAKDNRQLRRPANRIRPYVPTTSSGRNAKINREWVRSAETGIEIHKTMQGMKSTFEQMKLKMQRQDARWIIDRSKKGIKGDIARSMSLASDFRQAGKAIRRRAARASAAAARGSKPAARAREIYGNQLAFTGKGKPKPGRNNLRPGPRNTQGPPKRTRKPRSKK